LKKDEKVTLGQIRAVSGACTPDALETLEMMQFLTAQGKIVKIENKWRKITSTEIPLEPKRISYLETVLALMNNLNMKERDLAELKKLDIVPSSHLEEYLRFLSVVTSKGIVRRKINSINTLTQRGRIYLEDFQPN
jgi:hypothetical protein